MSKRWICSSCGRSGIPFAVIECPKCHYRRDVSMYESIEQSDPDHWTCQSCGKHNFSVDPYCTGCGRGRISGEPYQLKRDTHEYHKKKSSVGLSGIVRTIAVVYCVGYVLLVLLKHCA